MVGCGRAQGIQWRLNYIHSMKYAEVINASIAANSAGVLYWCTVPNKIVLKNYTISASVIDFDGQYTKSEAYHSSKWLISLNLPYYS